ncbi:MAG: hypothetical protein WC378_13690 [Opitutaceae bacterium]|jgi:hypothetical protein
MNLNASARWLALGAGALDLSSGLGLVLLPAFTLRLMGVAVPGSEALVFVRFVGVFVASVGACYLWAVLAPGIRMRVVLGGTLFFRAGVFVFTGLCVLAGALDAGWLAVTAADAGLIIAQAWLLAKGVGADA